jgi:transposase
MSRKHSRSHSPAGRRARTALPAPFRPTAPERFCAQYRDYTGLHVVHPHAAGIDIGGSLSHFVAVEVAPETLEVREFGCDTEELYRLRDYLLRHQVTTVALESTGVYWIPIYDILEKAGLTVCLVNPTQVKNVPGRRKDDKLDCRWLLTLHTFGLLSASFRPCQAMRPLRTIWRQRQQLVQLQADEIRRMQKCLDEMNLRVHKAISDLAGVTGCAIIQAILQGERDPAVLATFRDPRCRCSEEELRRALTGHYKPEVIFLLQLAYDRHQHLRAQIAACDAAIEPLLTGLIPLADDDVAAKVRAAGTPTRQTATDIRKHMPAYDLRTYLTLLLNGDATSQPGLGPLLVMDVITEVGIDLSKWPTEKHFASYVTCAPKHDISGGKILSRHTQKSQQRVAVAFRQAAATVTRTDTALGAFYRRLAVRIGKGKALVATARKIACQFYRFMRYGQTYAELGVAAYEERYRHQQIASLEKRAKALGYQVTPLSA